jgi:hypothetical protein
MIYSLEMPFVSRFMQWKSAFELTSEPDARKYLAKVFALWGSNLAFNLRSCRKADALVSRASPSNA